MDLRIVAARKTAGFFAVMCICASAGALLVEVFSPVTALCILIGGTFCLGVYVVYSSTLTNLTFQREISDRESERNAKTPAKKETLL